MDAVVSVSGSSPAYVCMFIEAMADAAVADGMPRAQAYKFAAQAVLGSAKMVLETISQRQIWYTIQQMEQRVLSHYNLYSQNLS